MSYVLSIFCLYTGQEGSVMISKMSYARNRWGCTLFYVDSNGGPFDATPAKQFQVLFIVLFYNACTMLCGVMCCFAAVLCCCAMCCFTLFFFCFFCRVGSDKCTT